MEYICSYCNQNFGNHKTEYRKHIKNCILKPNSYNCSFCGKIFKNKGSMIMHEIYNCDNNPNKKEQKHVCGFKIHQEKFGSFSKKGGWDCYCGLNFRTRRELEKHKKECNALKSSKAHILYVDYVCQFCNKNFFNKPINSKTLHEKKCLCNPNRIPNKNVGRKRTESEKKKLSETMKKKIENGTFIVPYKRNHSSKISYPERYFMEVLKEFPVKYNYQVGLYQLDFAIPEKMAYVEIDGEQHYVDKRIVEHDKKRTENLNSLGWKRLKRVRWSEFQKLSQDDKKIFCENLINCFSII